MKNYHLEPAPSQDPLLRTPEELAHRIVDGFASVIDLQNGQVDVFTIDPNDFVLGSDVYVDSEREVARKAFDAMHGMFHGSKKLSLEQEIDPANSPARETRTYWSFAHKQGDSEKHYYVTEYDNAFGTRGRLPFSAVITARKPDEMRELEELQHAHMTSLTRLPLR